MTERDSLDTHAQAASTPTDGALEAWADRMNERARAGAALYSSPGLDDQQANVLALELIRQFDGLPIPVIKQVLNRAGFWVEAVSTLHCGEASEFARAVAGWQHADRKSP